MNPEQFEKAPVRKWPQLTPEEQRQEFASLRQSRYFRLLSRDLQRLLNQIV